MQEPDASAPAGTLLAVGAAADGETTADDGGLPALPTTRPLLYRAQFNIPGASDDFVITHERDALVIWYFTRDDGVAPDATWFRRARIALARGAKVTAS